MNEEERANHNFDGFLIAGSSNLTKAGLKGQQEFNVEIKDYGYQEAAKYFEELWENAVPVKENLTLLSTLKDKKTPTAEATEDTLYLRPGLTGYLPGNEIRNKGNGGLQYSFRLSDCYNELYKMKLLVFEIGRKKGK